MVCIFGCRSLALLAGVRFLTPNTKNKAPPIRNLAKGWTTRLYKPTSSVAVGLVEAAHFWGGQLFVLSRTKLSHYPTKRSCVAQSYLMAAMAFGMILYLWGRPLAHLAKVRVL